MNRRWKRTSPARWTRAKRRPTECRAMSNRLREILGQLLAFDTTSRESNLALIAWIGDFLRARGVTSQL
ncbi:MAG: acetylornithine deacetylase, partial [Klebsiella grimontii]|nr:acetylornithine deacetylase [Klebsiella grimontii]